MAGPICGPARARAVSAPCGSSKLSAERRHRVSVLHEHRGWASASILLDLWAAFEQILRGHVLQACRQLDFPPWLAKLQVKARRAPGVVCLGGCCSD
eukprot:7376054-Pyramimonas_sp.AAC.1